VLVNLHGSLRVLISHTDDCSQGPQSDFVARAQDQVRSILFPIGSARAELSLVTEQRQQLALSETDAQQRLQARLMAVAQLYVFLNAFLGYIVPMYIGYINELRDKLQWLQQRQQRQQHDHSASNTGRGYAHGRGKGRAAVHYIAALQLALLAHKGRWIRAALLHHLLLHGASVVCWGLSHLAARPVLLVFGCAPPGTCSSTLAS
jgi:hypothetical protein